ncbi:neuromedin-S [Brachionichthys hirsutus]|uniref:neuromedin-S n=1 Tax=Brachionichthys hirsutus TaxID=412623 RepID=UPI003604968A
MTFPSVRHVCLLCLFCFLGPWSAADTSPVSQCGDGARKSQTDFVFRLQARDVQAEDASDDLWKDQNEDQIQNVFKRFLFHYSKARDSVGTLQRELGRGKNKLLSYSVHPLMRLSPKLSQTRNKKLVLLVRIYISTEDISVLETRFKRNFL